MADGTDTFYRARLVVVLILILIHSGLIDSEMPLDNLAGFGCIRSKESTQFGTCVRVVWMLQRIVLFRIASVDVTTSSHTEKKNQRIVIAACARESPAFLFRSKSVDHTLWWVTGNRCHQFSG